MGGITKFKLLGERLKSGLGLDRTFFPFYDNSSDADFRVSMRTMISFIGDYISGGGSSTFEALEDSPYDNTQLAEALDSKQDKPNGVLTGCTITLGSYGGSGSNNDIRVTEGTWRISPSEYGNVGSGNTDFLDIALSASGLQRYVELVGTTSNTIIKVEGTESAIAVRPVLGAGQVSLGSILVKDALIDPPVPDLSGYVPLAGTSNISGNLFFNNSGREIGRDGKSSIKFNDTQIYANVEDVDNQAHITPSVNGGNANVNLYAGDKNDSTRSRSFNVSTGQAFSLSGDIIKYDVDRTTEINSEPKALITKEYADAHYLGDSGTVNTGSQYQLVYYAANGTTISPLTLITGDKALISNANGLPVAATTTSTEIGYLNGVTSSIQTQLNAAIKVEIVKNPSVANLVYSASAVPYVLGSNYFLEYIDNATESARFQDSIPQNYKNNGCTVELHWRAATATSGNVVWATDFMRQNSNSSLTESFGTQKTATTACSGTLNNKVISSLSFSHAELASLVGGEAFKIRVSRIGGNGSDTMSGFALLELVVIKFS